MGIWHIAKTNLKKNKGASLSFLGIVALTAFLLMTGITIVTQIGELVDRKVEELDCADGGFWVRKDDYKDTMLEMVANDDRVTDYEMEEVVYLNGARINYGGEYDSYCLIANAECERRISPLKLTSEDKGIPKDKAVYLPDYAELTGYSLGDDYTITYRNTAYTFQVAGFFEALEFMLPSNRAIRVYAAPEAFNKIKETIGSYYFVNYQCKEQNQAEDIQKKLTKENKETFNALSEGGNAVFTSQEYRDSVQMPAAIIGSMLMGIAFIIAIIAVLFLRFRIVSAIENYIHSFGVLQAMGYTTKQIIASFLLEYGSIGIIGSILGVGLVTLIYHPIESAIASMCGVSFELWFNPVSTLGLILVMSALIVAYTFLCCRKVRHFTPVKSLRGGMETHNFKKNYFPLHKEGLIPGLKSVYARVGLKNIILYRKSYLMVATILMGISFILIFCATLFNSFVMDKMTLVYMTGIEVADASVTVTAQTDAMELAKEIEAMEGVRKTSMYDWVSLTIDDMDIWGFCSDDFSQLETVSTYEGEQPVLDNEIAISGVLGKHLNKGIGDMITVEKGNFKKDYFITGLFNCTNNSGKAASITLNGFLRIAPAYQRKDINIYLDTDYTFTELNTALEQQFGFVGSITAGPDETQKSAAEVRAMEKIAFYMEHYGINSVDYAVMKDGEILFSGSSAHSKLLEITNLKDTIEVQIGVYTKTISAVIIMIYIIATLIVLMIMSMTMKGIIKKHAVQIGIQKAMGYESKEIALQYTLSFLPSILGGTILGGMIGAICTSPLITAMFSSMGAMNLNITLPLAGVVVTELFMIGIVTLLTMVYAWGNRKISAYSLLTE